jgi:hypothetical protein
MYFIALLDFEHVVSLSGYLVPSSFPLSVRPNYDKNDRHEMRHTFVSMAQDLPDGKLKLLVGHSRNMDTRGVYGHQRTGDAQATAKDLTDLFNEVLLPENQGGGQNGGQIA